MWAMTAPLSPDTAACALAEAGRAGGPSQSFFPRKQGAESGLRQGRKKVRFVYVNSSL